MVAKNDNYEEFLNFQKQALEGWSELCQQMMGQFNNPFSSFGGMQNMPFMAGMQPNMQMPPMFSMPFDMLNRTMGVHAPFPGDMFKAFMPQQGFSAASHPLGKHLEQFLGTPALGYTREAQTSYQNLAITYKAYMDALKPYVEALSKLSSEGMLAFQEALKARSDKGEGAETMREAYNLWIDVHEALFAEFAMTEEYQEIYGNLINALMAFKKQEGVIVDEYLQSMNIPTKAEVDTLHKRMQETRRELRALKKQLQDKDKSAKPKAVDTKTAKEAKKGGKK